MAFVLLLAPGVLAAAALLLARLEILAEGIEPLITGFLTPKSAHAMDQIPHTGDRSETTRHVARR
jgi:hypothetical protein